MKAFASHNLEHTKNRIALDDLRSFSEEWLLDGQVRQHTKQTLVGRSHVVKKLIWFFEQNHVVEVGSAELKAFMVYLAEPQAEGRWGNTKLTGPMRPVSVHRYYRDMRALFAYALAEELISINPMSRIKPPVVRADTKQPIATEHLQSLLKAARRSPQAKRDTALLWLLLDSGLRAAEISSLKVKDVDIQARILNVKGKGNKLRQMPFGATTAKALLGYMRERKQGADDAMFLSRKNTPLGVSGLFQIVKRLSKAANVPCPGLHSFRRTFAVSVLRNGANVFAVQAMMGHSDLETTKRYVAIAQSDIEEQHRLYSPADMFNLKKK